MITEGVVIKILVVLAIFILGLGIGWIVGFFNGWDKGTKNACLLLRK